MSSKIIKNTFEKLSPKPLQKTIQKPFQNLSKNLSKTDPPKIEFCVYIYTILEQPGLTLEREARLIGGTILR